VDGLESEKLPVDVAAGTQVCIPQRTAYKSEGERFIFQQWSSGSTDNCIAPTRPGAYRALYSHEVLVLIRSAAPGIQRSMWVTFGEPLDLDVPELVPEAADTRYRFQLWSDGETPFQHSNTIAPMKPTVLEVKWAREHQIKVEAPEGADIKGSGWYPDGSNLVLRAPDTLAGANDQERWKFASWQSDSYPAAVIQNPQTAQTAVKVDAPYTVRAAYDKQYLVDASSPFGSLKHDWVKDGESVVLEAPATTDVVPDRERLVFKRWDGMDGLLSPKITGKVDKPIIVTAAYERQVMLKVNAPHGASGDGWQKVGSVTSVSVPGSVSEMFLLNSTFAAFGGYPAGQSSIQVLVNEPTTLTALYRTEPNFLVLVLLLGLPLLAVIVYLTITRGWLDLLRARVRAKVRRWRAKRWPFATFTNKTVTHTTAPLPAAADIHGRNGTHLTLPIGEERR